MFSGNKDDYGKEDVPPLPLSFDRVLEGRSPHSTAPLLNLPFEILGVILHHVETASLASLALVSRDCRQLARSRQFASIQLDYSDSSFALITALAAERNERSENKGFTVSPSLGACIRRITVATHPGWVSHRHKIALDEDFAALEEAVQTARLEKASGMFFDVYIPAIGGLLSSLRTMPHLELLDWEDKVVLSRSFFTELASSSIKHLKLFQVQVDGEFGIELPSALGRRKWPLQTLHLELSPSLHKLGQLSTSMLCESILGLCASTLESLTWISMRGGESKPSATSDLASLCFPKLRHLKLERVNFSTDTAILEALIQDNLRTFVANIDSHPEFFSNRGTVTALETFIWHQPCMDADHSLDFLRANSQLTKLSLSFAVPDILLETELLPLLSQSFSCLKSLSLKWQGNFITESALEMLSSLTSLEQIHLSAGEQFGWEQDWLIDHDLMRSYLRKLSGLRKIALSRDTYRNVLRGASDRFYYQDRYTLGAPGRLDLDTQNRLWEQKHCQHMLSEANEYARVLPNLEWLYCGQLVMGFKSVPEVAERVAVALSPERDDCWTLLTGMFELSEH